MGNVEDGYGDNQRNPHHNNNVDEGPVDDNRVRKLLVDLE
jgi:hypothetical protein